MKHRTFPQITRLIVIALPLILFVPAPRLCCQTLNPRDDPPDPLTLEHSNSKARDTTQSVLERARLLMEEVRAASYPELSATKIQVRILKSQSDFFRTRLRFPDFFLRAKIRYVIKVNPKVFELKAPEEGLQAIMAHELGHVAYLKKRKRLQLLGMARLASKKFTASFERRTDLEAISRGYGEGLKAYRQWLYRHVPGKKLKEKKQNYFSPAEIEILMLRIRGCPELLKYWYRNPPQNLQEIERKPPEVMLPCSSQQPSVGKLSLTVTDLPNGFSHWMMVSEMKQ